MTTAAVERALAQLASRQLGLFTSEQALALGLTARAIQHREQIGRIRRVHPRVFAVAGAPVTFQQQVRAATLGIDGAVASHESAALLRHFDPRPSARVVVTVPRGGTARLEGVIVHRSARLPDRHVSSVNGIPTTSLARTLQFHPPWGGVYFGSRGARSHARRNSHSRRFESSSPNDVCRLGAAEAAQCALCAEKACGQSSWNTRTALSRRNLGQTSSLKATPGMSAKIRSSESPMGK